jgi:hypothetical protein
MIILRNHLMEIHIRTKRKIGWSDVVASAIRINNDVVEVDATGYYINYTKPSDAPSTIGGIYPFIIDRDNVRIMLSGGQFIQLFFYSGIVRLNGHGSDFYDSTGMLGNWAAGGVFGRDGEELISNYTQLAIEWEVNETKGDPILFRTPSVNFCEEVIPVESTDPTLRQLAENACAYIQDEGYMKECIFDVITTQNVSFAANIVCTQPLAVEELCCAATNGCENRGGQCVWRCNTEFHECLPDLCSEALAIDVFGPTTDTTVDGCSCAVPKVSNNEGAKVPTMPPWKMHLNCRPVRLLPQLCPRLL